MAKPLPGQISGETERALRDLPIACHELDRLGNVIWVNPALCRLLALTAEQILHQPVWSFVTPEERETSRLAVARKLSAEVALGIFERSFTRADGSRVVLEIHEQYRRGADGEILGMRSFLIDITARKNAEEALHKVHEGLEHRIHERTQELELAVDFLRREMDERRLAEKEHRKLEAQMQHTRRLESMGVLAGGVAHKFNNLLTSIMGYASLANSEVTAGSLAGTYLEQVLSAASSAAELTQQMLAYSGRGQFVLERVDLSRMVEQTVRLLESVISKKAVLTLDLAPDLPMVEGDLSQVRQMLINLASNASDALEDRSGEIWIRTGLMWAENGELSSLHAGHTVPAGLYVYLEVADTGSGMDADTVGRIFDPFFTTRFAGRGLGLPAVMGITRAHRGSIRVVSAPSQGTTVRIFFPALQDAETKVQDTREAETSAFPRAGTILVVDDEEPIRRLTRAVLEDAGLTVLSAADGNEALRVFHEHCGEIHAVLLDLTMPGIDGAEVFQSIHRLRPETRVVLCSGYNECEFTSRLGEERPAAFLRKPYQPRELLQLLSNVW
ncbi:MAG: sensor hybrid histidine kinase [Candidatus Solibacter sp.]|jgi:PAS domain S-box-containing protein|nr:sensor hybrid histidine kinase [Candidatus Solibacter sp.]